MGRLLQCLMTWLQLSVGVSFAVLEHPTRALPHMESTWVASMRQFLASTDTCSLQLDNPCIPPLQRENDEYVMDLILDSNHYSPAEIRNLNYCRLYVEMVTISDCTTMPCGTMIDQDKTHGSPTPVSSRSAHLAVHQAKPSIIEWRMWKRACLLWTDINGRLRKPLGKWLLPPL